MASRKDATVKLMVNSAIFWLVIAITLGLIQAIEFIAPDSFRGIAWLVFPRIRQAHVNGLAFGWLSMAMVAGWYYVVPRLTKTGIHSETLGIVVAWMWNLALAVGVVGLTLGWTQAREYAELAWPVDIAIMVVLLLTGIQPLPHDHGAQGAGALRDALVRHGHADLVPDRLSPSATSSGRRRPVR